MFDYHLAATAIETAGAALQTQDGESIKAGVWATAAAIITGLIGLFGIYFTTRRGILESASAGRTADFRRLREEIERRDGDIDEMRTEMRAMRGEVAEAGRVAADMKLQMVRLQTAFRLVSSELARHDPDNPVLVQATSLIAAASMTDTDILRAGVASLGAKPPQ